MSALGNLIPLIVLFVVVGGGAYIGYQIYLWSNEMTDRGKKHMEKKHMTFTKDGGLKVGVKEVKDEAYADKTQNVLVNVWNNASFPNDKTKTSSASRTTSMQSQSQSRPSTGASSTTGATSNLTPPASRSSARSSSHVSGGW